MSSASEIKTQLWTAASRLQRAQSKFEHLAQTSRKDIASVISRELQLRASDDSQNETETEKLLASGRLKAEKLIVDDEACDLMGMIERYCDVLLEGQLSENTAQLDQDCLEAVSGILAASFRVDSPELHALSHSLAQRYPDLLSESELRENISLKLVAHLNPGRPSQTLVDTKLVSIAQKYGLGNWTPPELLPADRTRELTLMLEYPPRTVLVVDERRLRRLCMAAVPADAPSWVRYCAWSILLGVLPGDKSAWPSSKAKGRTDYVALSEQLLGNLSSQPLYDPSESIKPQDKALLQLTKDVEALPASIRDALSHCTIAQSPSTITEEIPSINHTEAVMSRISMLKNRNRPDAYSTHVTPLIPSITLDDPPSSPFSPTTLYSDSQNTPAPTATVLLPSSPPSQSSYDNILLRLLYIHSLLHSSHSTSFGPPAALAAIFAVVLTLAFQSRDTPFAGAKPDNTLTSIEADVFWMVQAIVGNTRELLEGGDEGDEVWTHKFSNIVRWADSELWMDLSRKGLDPALPYYSYRWIPTLFTHTLPLQTLLPIWDAIFSAQTPIASSPHQSTVQAEFIYTIGATMLIRARAAIFQTSHAGQDGAGGTHHPGTSSPSGGLTSFWKRQGKTPIEISLPHSPSPYSPIASPKTPLSPTLSAVSRGGLPEGSSGILTPGRLSSVFLVAVKLLQEYDVEAFGGIERLLGGSRSLWRRWCQEGRLLLESPLPQDTWKYPSSVYEEVPSQMVGNGSAGGVTASLSRIRNIAWRGIINEVEDTSYPPSPVEPETTPNTVVAPKLTVTAPVSEGGVGAGFFSSIGGGLGSKLTESVWKGVINQLDSPDPSPEVTPEPSPTRSSILVAHDEVEQAPERTIASASWSGGGAMSWAKGYADKLKSSETAANLTRTGSTLRAKASTVWARDATQNEQQDINYSPKRGEGKRMGHSPAQSGAAAGSQSGAMSPATSSVGSWGEMFSKRGSLPLVGSLIGESRSRGGSESSQAGSPAPHRDVANIHKRDSYSPPTKPTQFRAARDSVMGSIFSPGYTAFSPEAIHLPNPPPSAEASNKNPLQAALAALSGSPKVEAAPKRGPKPLLLNSGSLITPSGTRSGLSSRTPSRRPSPSPTPTPRAGDRFSLSTEGEDAAFNTSGFVSLKRGPLTNPRTAGYGVSTSSREGNRSSRTSTSSGVSSPAPSAREFDLESEEEPRGRVEGSGLPKRGFLVDRGPQSAGSGVAIQRTGTPPPRQPSIVPEVQASSSDENKSNYQVTDGIGTNSSTKINSKRHQNRPAPIATDSPSMSTRNLPELMITTPRSGENPQQHLTGNSEGVEDLTSVGTPVAAVSGATLSRSRSSTRRPKKPRRGSSEGRTSKPGAGEEDIRRSMLFVGPGESEEEGARADVEDLDDIYDMY